MLLIVPIMPLMVPIMLFRLVIGAVTQARAAKNRSEVPRERDRGDRGTLARAHVHARNGHTTANDSAAYNSSHGALTAAGAHRRCCARLGCRLYWLRPIASATTCNMQRYDMQRYDIPYNMSYDIGCRLSACAKSASSSCSSVCCASCPASPPLVLASPTAHATHECRYKHAESEAERKLKAQGFTGSTAGAAGGMAGGAGGAGGVGLGEGVGDLAKDGGLGFSVGQAPDGAAPLGELSMPVRSPSRALLVSSQAGLLAVIRAPVGAEACARGSAGVDARCELGRSVAGQDGRWQRIESKGRRRQRRRACAAISGGSVRRVQGGRGQ